MLLCKYCNTEKKNNRSLINHERLCKNNPVRQSTPFQDRKIQGIIKNNKADRGFENQYAKAKSMGLPVPVSPQKGKPGKGHPHTEEFKKRQRQNALDRKLGGVRQSKWIKYKGKTLGSSYELRVVQSLEENGIEWDTCKRFDYIDPTGKKRTYTPDIYLPQFNIYLDPKNDFLIENINPSLGFSDKEKIELVANQNNVSIIILSKHELSWAAIAAKINAPEAFSG